MDHLKFAKKDTGNGMKVVTNFGSNLCHISVQERHFEVRKFLLNNLNVEIS